MECHLDFDLEDFDGGDDDDDDHGPEIAVEDERYDSEEESDITDVPTELEAAHHESRIFLTQAKKQRAEVEKARGFFRRTGEGNARDKEEHMRKVKARLPCAACGALGHWKDDKECPMNKNKKSHRAHMTLHTEASRDMIGLGLVDTACAKTVAGEQWAKGTLAVLTTSGVWHQRVDENESFRFGPGRRLFSSYALIFPVCWGGHLFLIRVSIVKFAVPCLLSRPLLKARRCLLDMGQDCLISRTLHEVSVPLIPVTTNHVAVHVCQYTTSGILPRTRCS